MTLKSLLSYIRIPGNALSFWIRQRLHWSKGQPKLESESKEILFDYLTDKQIAKAEETAEKLTTKFHLESLVANSTKVVFRKNLYLIDSLENALEGLPILSEKMASLCGLDIGSQDWHYVFGLERWLRYHQSKFGREVNLAGIEVDGHGIYSNFHSRRDFALAYAAQTNNQNVHYHVKNFLDHSARDIDVITLFYPFVTRYHLLLWGLPLQFFFPERIIAHAATLFKKNGVFIVYCHTIKEHAIFVSLTKKNGSFKFLREGQVRSNLVDFYEAVQERQFSIWQKN